MSKIKLMIGDNTERIKELADCSVDTIVTDPPYGLGKEPDALAMLNDWLTSGVHKVEGSGFMGKKWDAFVPQPALWKECFRVLKPGGYLLSFGSTRTTDLIALGLRIAGFEVRDHLMWVFGSGYPKGGTADKQIDRAAGVERKKVGQREWKHGGGVAFHMRAGTERTVLVDVTEPETELAKEYEGWSTTLKPGYEPIILVRKPLDGTLAENIEKHGTGAMNTKACRVGDNKRFNQFCTGKAGGVALHLSVKGLKEPKEGGTSVTGRWPANFIHDGSYEVLQHFPREADCHRFFYCAKASTEDRDEGLDVMADRSVRPNDTRKRKNIHPTVKPTTLMRWLVRLVCPRGGTVLDPYMGSGSTGKACMLEGFNFIGIEMDEEHYAVARVRIRHARTQGERRLV